MQTLNTLNLQETHIGEEGLEQLTYALRKSTVIITAFSPVIILLIAISYRRLLRFT
jgi:hypothetical protein